MNTDNFLIEENDIELAQNICKVIANTNVRNRAVANSLASGIAQRFYDKDKFDVDIKSGLHNIGHVLEDIDIADIYINNSYIDVRLYFNDEELSVPKSHFDNDLLPVAYMFIKVTPDLSGATVTGFITPENIDKSNSKDGFIIVDETQLVSFYDIETLLVTKEDTYSVTENDIFAYLENNLKDKYVFYRALIASKDGRLRLARADKAQYAFNFISINDGQATENANDEELLAPTDDLLSDDLVVDNLEENFEIDSLTSDDLVLDGSDDLIGLEGDNESLELADSGLELEETELQNDDLASSLDLVDDLEPAQNDELSEQVEQVNIDDISIADDIELENALGDDLENTIEEKTPELSLELDEDVEPNKEIDEESNSNFEFSTVTSPSLNTISDNIENLFNEEQNDFVGELAQSVEDVQTNNIADGIDKVDDILSMLPDNDEKTNNTDVLEENVSKQEADEDVELPEQTEDNQEQIEALFNQEDMDNSEDDVQDFQAQKTKPKSSIKPLAIVAVLVVIGALGYLGFNHFANQNNQEDETNNLVTDSVQTQAPVQQQEAMPVETVETVTPKLDENEGTSESIPAIEQNLDASILVSNLKVDWEVPAGYAANTSARRYLVKLGKVIQLNLKTELLLLNKPPITNKIAVEIKYNNGEKKFEAVGVTVSSGEKSVDDLIMQTVNKALAMKLSVNSDSFNNLQGNPVLIIHL